MEKSEVLKRIARVGLVPVIRAESRDEAIKIIDAIAAGGLPIVEVTMTVPGAISIIEALHNRDASLVVGAGTVLDPETARACILAGAQFVVSPALPPLRRGGYARSAHPDRGGDRVGGGC